MKKAQLQIAIKDNAAKCQSRAEASKTALFRWLWRIQAKKWLNLLEADISTRNTVFCDMSSKGVCQYQLKDGCCDLPVWECPNQTRKGINK